jgi:hypothetical protein
MNEIGGSDRTAHPVRRRERGIEPYARIFDVPEKDVPAVRVGPVYAEEVFLAAGAQRGSTRPSPTANESRRTARSHKEASEDE